MDDLRLLDVAEAIRIVKALDGFQDRFGGIWDGWIPRQTVLNILGRLAAAESLAERIRTAAAEIEAKAGFVDEWVEADKWHAVEAILADAAPKEQPERIEDDEEEYGTWASYEEQPHGE